MFSMVSLGFIAYARTTNGRKVPFLSIEIVSLLLIFTFFMGVRYGVGTDYFNYLDIYKWGYGLDDLELGFRTLTRFLKEYNFHFSYFFGVIAFVQIFFLFYAFKNERYLYPFMAFVLIFGAYFISLVNVMRQGISVCIFIFAIKYIEQKKFWLYLLWCGVAFLFHKSAVLLVPLYFVLFRGRDFFKSRKVQLILFLVVIITNYTISSVFVDTISTPLEIAIELLDYSQYQVRDLFNERNLSKVGSGIGLLILIFTDLLVIFFSQKLKVFFGTKRFVIFYNLYFVGILFRVLFSFSFILLRPFLYFTYIKLIVLAYMLYYLVLNSRKNITLLYLLLLILLVVASFVPFIVNSEENNAKFEFFWNV